MIDEATSLALRRWIATFDVDGEAAVESMDALLDGRILVNLFNTLSDDKIPESSLKTVTGDADWVSRMLNIRPVSTKVLDFLKSNGEDFKIDVSAIARRHDMGEMNQLLKCILIYALKCPHKKEAIAHVRQLDAPDFECIQKLLKDNQKQQTPPQSPRTQQTTEADPEIELLKTQLKEIRSQLVSKASELKVLMNSSESPALQHLKELADAAKVKEEQLRQNITARQSQIKQHQEDIEQLSNQRTALEQEAKRLIASFTNETLDLNEAITRLSCPTSNTSEIAALRKSIQRKETELNALGTRLKEQNGISKAILKQKYDRLSEEFAATPIGETKMLCLKYQKMKRKLESEIEELENQAKDLEATQMLSTIQAMADQKSRESQLLARKLSLMQATAEQCDMRLARLRLNVDLQMRTQRVRRFQNCFKG